MSLEVIGAGFGRTGTHSLKLALERLGRTAEASECARSIVVMKVSNDEALPALSRRAGAHALFLLVEPEYRDYVAFRFKTQSTLGKDLLKKLEMRKALSAKYLRVVEERDAEMAVAALVRIAALSKHLAQAIVDAPLPKGIDDDPSMCTYSPCIRCHTPELDGPAIEMYRLALRKAFELGVYGEWTEEAVGVLTELVPDAFGELHVLPLRMVET